MWYIGRGVTLYMTSNNEGLMTKHAYDKKGGGGRPPKKHDVMTELPLKICLRNSIYFLIKLVECVIH